VLSSNITKQIFKIYKWIKKNFFPQKNQDNNFYFMLEGDYFCTKQKISMLVLRSKYQRKVLIRPTQEIAHNKEIIQILSPIDAFIIGILANKESNGFKEYLYKDVTNMRRLRNKTGPVKLDTLLQITKTNFDQPGQETLTISSITTNKEVNISINQLLKNKELLYGLAPIQALSLGYIVCEYWIRHQITETINHVA
jgi:hypothetical protein